MAAIIDLDFDRDDPFACAIPLASFRGDPVIRCALDKALDALHRIDAQLRHLQLRDPSGNPDLFDPSQFG